MKKRNLMLIDKKIYSPEELSVKYKNALWVNVIQKYRNEIAAQLKELKIPENHIVNYLFE